MGLYNSKKDYEELVKENINKAKLLYDLQEEDKKLVIELLNKKEKVIEKNGLFANLELKRIDKKIQKIQHKYKKIN